MPDPDASETTGETPRAGAVPSTADALALLARADLEIAGRLMAASNTTLYCRLVDGPTGGDDGPDGADEAVDTDDGDENRDDDRQGDEGRGDQGEGDEGRDEGQDEGEDDDDLLAGPGCVYKPVAGERPLWDFPDGTLAAREVAAFLVSEATGWGLVPPTILRDGPLGLGMCQLWMDHDDQDELVDVLPRRRPRPGWLHVVDAHGGAGEEVMLVHADDPELRRTAVLDVVLNNTDRKAGHLLPTAAGLRVVDHGVTFHVEPKLRTVLWGWAGSPLIDEEIEVLERLQRELAGDLGESLRDLLTAAEVRQTSRRVARLLRVGVLPSLSAGWRALPWPPF